MSASLPQIAEMTGKPRKPTFPNTIMKRRTPRLPMGARIRAVRTRATTIMSA